MKDEFTRHRDRKAVIEQAIKLTQEARAAELKCGPQEWDVVADDDVERTRADCTSVLGYDATAVPDVAAVLADRDLDEAFSAAMLQRLADIAPWCSSPADLPRWLVAALDDNPLAVVERMARRSHLRGV